MTGCYLAVEDINASSQAPIGFNPWHPEDLIAVTRTQTLLSTMPGCASCLCDYECHRGKTTATTRHKQCTLGKAHTRQT